MKSLLRPAVAVAAFFLAPVLVAQNSGPSANGDFQFTTGNVTKSLQFDARIQNNGSTRGQILLAGSDDLGDQDVDGGGDANPGGSQTSFTLAADVDCLRISGNRAILGGVVTSSSVPGYVGVRTLLVVEDGGEGAKKPADKFTWDIYRGATFTWVASDAELQFDPGVGLSWYATDAERNDDVGRPSHTPKQGVDCHSFALSAYDLGELPAGAGNIQVRP